VLTGVRMGLQYTVCCSLQGVPGELVNSNGQPVVMVDPEHLARVGARL